MVEGTFLDGTFLVTVHQPVCTEEGDVRAALYSSFYPAPEASVFREQVKADERAVVGNAKAAEVLPGAMVDEAGCGGDTAVSEEEEGDGASNQRGIGRFRSGRTTRSSRPTLLCHSRVS